MNIASKQVQWVLNKATPNITLSKQSITLDSDNLTDTFTITTNSTGNLSVISSDTSIATVSLSGNTVTVEALADGTCTITVNVTENSNYVAGTKTLSIDVQLLSTTLNDNSWNTIKTAIQSGEAPSLWNVGDTKEVILNGSVGSKSFNSYSCYATILGFDHNASLETNGSHSISFIIGKNSSGNDIIFYGFSMNTSRTSVGGWKNSYMRALMPQFKTCLPADLQGVLKTVTKYTDNNGNSSYASENVTATTEQVFLPAEYEALGYSEKYANPHEKEKQIQYTYFKNGNGWVRCRHDNGNRECWWFRSPYYNNNMEFCAMTSAYTTTDNCALHYDANYTLGIAPVFVV